MRAWKQIFIQSFWLLLISMGGSVKLYAQGHHLLDNTVKCIQDAKEDWGDMNYMPSSLSQSLSALGFPSNTASLLDDASNPDIVNEALQHGERNDQQIFGRVEVENATFTTSVQESDDPNTDPTVERDEAPEAETREIDGFRASLIGPAFAGGERTDEIKEEIFQTQLDAAFGFIAQTSGIPGLKEAAIAAVRKNLDPNEENSHRSTLDRFNAEIDEIANLEGPQLFAKISELQEAGGTCLNSPGRVAPDQHEFSRNAIENTNFCYAATPFMQLATGVVDRDSRGQPVLYYDENGIPRAAMVTITKGGQAEKFLAPFIPRQNLMFQGPNYSPVLVNPVFYNVLGGDAEEWNKIIEGHYGDLTPRLG